MQAGLRYSIARVSTGDGPEQVLDHEALPLGVPGINELALQLMLASLSVSHHKGQSLRWAWAAAGP